jgi:hypothetical protein
MSSISGVPPQLYPAPTAHGDPQLTGLRGWVGFALGSTLLILPPTALWVTSITDGRAGLRALLHGCFVGGSALAGGWWCCSVCR